MELKHTPRSLGFGPCQILIPFLCQDQTPSTSYALNSLRLPPATRAARKLHLQKQSVQWEIEVAVGTAKYDSKADSKSSCQSFPNQTIYQCTTIALFSKSLIHLNTFYCHMVRHLVLLLAFEEKSWNWKCISVLEVA